jgi:ectoine hydroxylase-related dioxygenase (phytanoyl-CoA dioxygenase family)
VRRFMERGEVSGDVELRVIEMTGEPGDVLLTHPLLLHAPAKNCGSVPRIALSSTVYRSGVQWSALYT